MTEIKNITKFQKDTSFLLTHFKNNIAHFNRTEKILTIKIF